ncbi:pyridoxal phosphate-dependent decarboxylase family protein [Vagococcus sp.]|uniref:pyridoxal phosphate-dependent decarboxylase family protein n=1 Tax=Vagococcus sp. TaxID=1933889 RepID=UPI003F9EB7B1
MEMKEHMKQFIDDFYQEDTNYDELPVVQLIEQEEFSTLSEMPIPEDGQSVEEMVHILRKEVYPNRSIGEHPRNFAFIPAPIEEVSKLGDLINLFYNPNASGWYPSSGTACIEHSLINWLCEQAGYSDDASGIFVSGGSIANLTAAIAARDNKLKPDDISKGVAYISNQAHHSVNKALHIIGIPEERIHRLETTADLKISYDDLERQIEIDQEKGFKPFLVMATAGTTNAGVIDPIEKLAEVSQRHNLWLHIDGAFGASLLLSKTHKNQLKGIELADSITWDAHKWLFQTYSCAMLLVKHRSTLLNSFSNRPEYLEDAHQADRTDFWDLGIELSRPARGIKLWLTLQTLGTKKISEQIDYGIALAEFTETQIRQTKHWEIMTPAQTAIINWRYNNPKFTDAELNKINTQLSEKMTHSGYAQVLTTKLAGKTVLRMCTLSPLTTETDIVKTIEKLNQWASEIN